MAELQTLAAQKRDALKKGHNRRMRVQNLVPGVYYNAEGENIALQMPMLPLVKLYEKVGRTNVFNLEIEDNGKKTIHPAFVWAAQYHPVKSTFTHIDFYGVDLDKEITIEVPLEFTGTPKGVKVGGQLEVYRETITLAAKPALMPRKVVIDITDLELHKTLHISDLSLAEGVRATVKSTIAVVAVVDPKADEAAA